MTGCSQAQISKKHKSLRVKRQELKLWSLIWWTRSPDLRTPKIWEEAKILQFLAKKIIKGHFDWKLIKGSLGNLATRESSANGLRAKTWSWFYISLLVQDFLCLFTIRRMGFLKTVYTICWRTWSCGHEWWKKMKISLTASSSWQRPLNVTFYYTKIF